MHTKNRANALEELILSGNIDRGAYRATKVLFSDRCDSTEVLEQSIGAESRLHVLANWIVGELDCVGQDSYEDTGHERATRLNDGSWAIRLRLPVAQGTGTSVVTISIRDEGKTR